MKDQNIFHKGLCYQFTQRLFDSLRRACPDYFRYHQVTKLSSAWHLFDIFKLSSALELNIITVEIAIFFSAL